MMMAPFTTVARMAGKAAAWPKAVMVSGMPI